MSSRCRTFCSTQIPTWEEQREIDRPKRRKWSHRRSANNQPPWRVQCAVANGVMDHWFEHYYSPDIRSGLTREKKASHDVCEDI